MLARRSTREADPISALPAPWLQGLTLLAYVLHVAAGAVGLVAGFVAIFAMKGGRLHRRAGTVFVASMLTMAAFGCVLGLVLPDQINVFIGAFVFYLVATAWLTVRRGEGAVGRAERLALLVAGALCAPFAILAYQLATGSTPMFGSTVAFKGPVLVAIYAFAAVIACAAVGDARLLRAGRITGVPRIARHLWRMCLGLTLATGSGFTNGLSRLLPGPHHVPAAFFLPQFVPLCLLVYWLIRVRYPGWRRNGAPPPSG